MEFKDHPKVKEARQLIREAEMEINIDRKKDIGNQICVCGHTRSEHGPSLSINYTEGICDDCDCMNFLLRRITT